MEVAAGVWSAYHQMRKGQQRQRAAFLDIDHRGQLHWPHLPPRSNNNQLFRRRSFCAHFGATTEVLLGLLIKTSCARLTRMVVQGYGAAGIVQPGQAVA